MRWRMVLMLAVLAGACATSASAVRAGQIGWPVSYASDKLMAKYEPQGADDALCTPVGQVARQKGVSYYGEFACAIDNGDGTESTLAIRPTSASQYVLLDPSKPRPAGTLAEPPYAGGSAMKMVGMASSKRTIELIDESDWKLVDPTHELATWQLGDLISVQPGKFYTVVDRTRNEALTGSYLGFALIGPGSS